MNPLKSALFVFPLLLLVGCGLLYEDYLDRQHNIAERKSETYVIGVAWNTKSQNTYLQSFLKGIKLGYQHFFPHQSLLGQKVLLDIVHTPDTKDATQDTIEHFQNDDRTIAVVGHAYSSLAEKAAIGYQHHGILFIAPTATNDLALQHNFNLVFRTIMKDSDIYANLLEYAMDQGWYNIAILYESTSYGDNVYHNIVADAYNYPDAHILLENTYPNNLVRPLIRTFVGYLAKSILPDVILTSDTAKDVNILCEELKLHNLSVPILTSFAVLGDDKLCKDYDYIYVAEQYMPKQITPRGKRFIQSYTETYGKKPDMHAVQGYESMLFLSEAISKSNSFVPQEVSSMLQTNSFEGVNGIYAFDENRGIVHKTLNIRPLHPPGETP